MTLGSSPMGGAAGGWAPAITMSPTYEDSPREDPEPAAFVARQTLREPINSVTRGTLSIDGLSDGVEADTGWFRLPNLSRHGCEVFTADLCSKLTPFYYYLKMVPF